MAKTKIIVIQMKEIIYTALFIGIGIVLIFLLVFLFKPKASEDTTNESAAVYNAGTYTSQIMLNNTALNLEVTVDPERIKGVRLVNIDESVTTMFPLLVPALAQIEDQLINDQTLTNIEISNTSRYTQTLLIDAISEVLEKAKYTGGDTSDSSGDSATGSALDASPQTENKS